MPILWNLQLNLIRNQIISSMFAFSVFLMWTIYSNSQWIKFMPEKTIPTTNCENERETSYRCLEIIQMDKISSGRKIGRPKCNQKQTNWQANVISEISISRGYYLSFKLIWRQCVLFIIKYLNNSIEHLIVNLCCLFPLLRKSFLLCLCRVVCMSLY